jgi:hypothetical protein
MCLLLAALLLAVDHQEYRALTRAGLRALVRGALPLLALAFAHLVALDPPAWLGPGAVRAVLVVALVADGALAMAMLGPVRRGAPPLFPMLLAVACLLAIGAAAMLLAGGRRDRG